MIFHNAGKYNGNEDSLPRRSDVPSAVAFKEPEDMKKLTAIVTVISLVITALALALACLRARKVFLDTLGTLASLAFLYPHELLHALCFQKDVYMYSNLKQGMLFVVGTESMSRARFIFMSLLPNLLFGLLPLLVFMLDPSLAFFGSLGALSLGAGAGDYLNVYNTLTQVPKGGKVFMSGMHSYWYKES